MNLIKNSVKRISKLSWILATWFDCNKSGRR